MTIRQTARKRLGALRQQRDYGPLFRPGPTRSAYIGWLGHLNAGDDAMFEAHCDLFPNANFWTVPNLGANFGLSLIRSLPWVTPPPVTFLGGGTLIGNGHFRRTIEAWFAAAPDSQAVMLSVGVEDPDFAGPRGRDSHAELQVWEPVLDRFDKVRVRGPRSKEILERYGIESHIVGDPALLLGESLPFTSVEERVIGLNIGQADNMWGDHDTLVAQISKLGRTMAGRGWTIRLFSVWPEDDAVAIQIAAAIGERAELVTYTGDVLGLIKQMGQCTVFVGEKLHAVILASCANVPSIALEYRPKCRDFQASVGREALTMRTDQIDVDLLLTMIDGLADDRDNSSAELAAAVDALRAEIRTAGSEIDRLLI